MYIFIDESGIFLPDVNGSAWSTAGAIIIPQRNYKKVERALIKLKASCNIDKNQEIKRNRPDSTSREFIEFIDILKKLGCTLHVASIRSADMCVSGVDLDRKSRIQAILQAGENNGNYNQETPHIKEIILNLNKLKPQQYAQLIIQMYMVDVLIEKVLSFYSKNIPTELSLFKWVIDQKEVIETNYDKLFKQLLPDIIYASSIRKPKGIIDGPGIFYLKHRYGYSDDDNDHFEYIRKTFKMDTSFLEKHGIPFSFHKMISSDLSMGDSALHTGLQVVDLLTSSLNRCLKLNFTDNEIMAQKIGALLVNSPRIDEDAFMLYKFPTSQEKSMQSQDHKNMHYFTDEQLTIFKALNDNAYRLYSEDFKVNFSKNVTNN